MKGDFIFPLNGLAPGENKFHRSAGKEFFCSFGNSEILDACLSVDIVILKSECDMTVSCEIGGKVTVLCDRCMERLELPVSETIRLCVKYGDGIKSGDEFTAEGYEIVYIPESDSDLDLRQIIYDYVCLSLPLRKVHNPGECNPQALKYLNFEDGEDSESGSNPFLKLKDIL
ncbi:MAG: YceD family protein [Bacteroidales bacterium]|jgi:uncharacterized metal-binding protein YceD (DUF177 family)|nr:YceD family protein [Bacteroidales bacterium]MCI1785231.1 YceD family protein [Bacteroidales bacterium]